MQVLGYLAPGSKGDEQIAAALLKDSPKPVTKTADIRIDTVERTIDASGCHRSRRTSSAIEVTTPYLDLKYREQLADGLRRAGVMNL